MENGRLVETGTKEQILKSPQNDYTKKLLAATLSI
jgi:ABC-type glutathione transport system ATPase component